MLIPLTEFGLKVEKKECTYDNLPLELSKELFWEGYNEANEAKEEDERLCLEIDGNKLAGLIYQDQLSILHAEDIDMDDIRMTVEFLLKKLKHFAKVVE